MIIECAKCASKFNLDETLLKSEGSKVKCSMCKHVFIAYPIKQISDEEPMSDKVPDQDLEDTLPLDSVKADFDLAFEKAIKEAETEESVSEEIASDKGADAFTEEPEVGPDDDETVFPRKRRGPSKMLILVLSIALLIAVGGTMLFLSLRNSSEKQESSDVGDIRLRFPVVDNYYLESNTAGQLYVIKGRVRNDYPKPRSYILVKAAIEDDKGKIVKTGMAYAGNSFSDRKLKEMSLDDLAKARENRSGYEGANVNIPSGETIPFMIVFENLPENVAVLSVEAVSSEPGK